MRSSSEVAPVDGCRRDDISLLVSARGRLSLSQQQARRATIHKPNNEPRTSTFMPNIASVLKEEITRLARKEVRSILEKTRKAASLHRRELAILKGQVSDLKRQVTALEKASRRAQVPTQPPDTADSTRFVPKGLTSTRKRLGLSVAELAKMMSVSDQTIYNWERGATKPRPEQRIKLASLRKIGKREMQEHLTARPT